MSLDLKTLLQPQQTISHGGIVVAKGIAERTVWDDHATTNPTHAVISAPDEAEAWDKSKRQITDILSYLTSESLVLDYGAGYGRVAQYVLPKKVLKGYIGVDSSYEMLSLFHRRYQKNDLEQRTPVLLVNADIHTTPLKDSCVDVVLVCAVFLHNHKDVVVKAMSEIKRILTPQGTLLVYSSFPRRATAMGIQGSVYQALLNLTGRPFKNGPVRYYSYREVETLCAGFSKVTITPVGFSLIPKTLIFLPSPLERWYRRGCAEPLNRFFQFLIPKRLHQYFAVHYDVVAVK
jgi:ubiquinone/menaquinone biosynthesis C-methylase UbiE